MAEPDVFVQEFAHEPGSVSKESDDLWLAVGSVRFFVIRKFSEAVSQEMTTSLDKKRESFVLNNYGGVKYKKSDDTTMRLMNPLVKDSEKKGGISVLKMETDNPDQVKYNDEQLIISPNLRYLLVKSGSHWHLCYNPLHRKAFGSLYRSTLPNTDKIFGKSMNDPSIYNMIENYCSSMQVPLEPIYDFTTSQVLPKNAYLDPTCNITVSLGQCALSSLINESMTDHSGTAEAVAFEYNNAAVNAAKAGSPPACACIGGPGMYVNTYLSAKTNNNYDSFVFIPGDEEEEASDGFPLQGRCDNDIVIQTCQTIMQAGGNIATSGTQISNQCGSAGYQPPAVPVAPVTPVVPATPVTPVTTTGTTSGTTTGTTSGTTTGTASGTTSGTTTDTASGTTSGTTTPSTTPEEGDGNNMMITVAVLGAIGAAWWYSNKQKKKQSPPA